MYEGNPIGTNIVITGIGPLLPGCDSREQLWRQLRDGESQLKFEEDPSGRTDVYAMGRLREFDPRRYLSEFTERYYTRCSREQQLYLSSLVIARDDAKLDLDSIPADRIGLFDGTSRGNAAYLYEQARRERDTPARELYTSRDLTTGLSGMAVGVAAALLGLRGPACTFSATCASGAVALGHALRELALGELDVAFATGHDSALDAPLFHMYADAGILSLEHESAERAVRPYSVHSGNAMGEGAVTLVLESRAHAERRGARILASLAGYKHGNNGAHPTHVDALGERSAALISGMLARAGVSPDKVSFVLGHGNGVRASDESELKYMARVFGARAREVPLLSTKPIYGHVLGASSALNAAAAALMVHHQYILPTINVDPARVTDGFTHQAGHGEAAPCDAGIVVTFGMGGQNAALLVTSPDLAASEDLPS